MDTDRGVRSCRRRHPGEPSAGKCAETQLLRDDVTMDGAMGGIPPRDGTFLGQTRSCSVT